MADERIATTTLDLITPEQERLLADERRLFDRLVALARALDAKGADAENAAMLRRHLDERFLLVIVGEVKAGKSSFINVLLGRDVCAVGPTPLTDKIQVLQWGVAGGESPSERLLEPFLLERDLDVELLREVSIVDTPGTNSILKQHSMLTEQFIPRADLVLFLTSIDRPYSESENHFLSLIADRWKKKVVFLLTKIDGREPGDVRVVCDWIKKSVVERHAFEPVVLPVSVRLEREGKEGGMEAVREFVRATLAEGEKMRLKLESPLASSQAVLDAIGQTLTGRSSLLDEDFRAVQDLDRQVEQFARELKERSHAHLTAIYCHFAACELRAKVFFERHAKLKELAFKKREPALRDAFEKEVLDELAAKHAETVQRTIDWLMREEIALYERCNRFLHEQVKPLANENVLPSEPARFEYRRDVVFATIADAYKKDMAALDVPGESRRFFDDASGGVKKQLALSAGAIVAGAGSFALIAKFSTLWFNVAGLAVAVGLGLTGLAILPAVRRRAIRKFSERLDQLLGQVRGSFTRAIAEEVEGARDRLRRAWEPFLLFHRTEASALAERHREWSELRRGFADFAQRLDHMRAARPSPR